MACWFLLLSRIWNAFGQTKPSTKWPYRFLKRVGEAFLLKPYDFDYRMVKFYRQVPGHSMEKLVLADHSVENHRMAIPGIALWIPFYRQKRVCTLQIGRPGLQPLNFKGDNDMGNIEAWKNQKGSEAVMYCKPPYEMRHTHNSSPNYAHWYQDKRHSFMNSMGSDNWGISTSTRWSSASSAVSPRSTRTPNSLPSVTPGVRRFDACFCASIGRFFWKEWETIAWSMAQA